MERHCVGQHSAASLPEQAIAALLLAHNARLVVSILVVRGLGSLTRGLKSVSGWGKIIVGAPVWVISEINTREITEMTAAKQR